MKHFFLKFVNWSQEKLLFISTKNKNRSKNPEVIIIY